jgi:hypothetical protein
MARGALQSCKAEKKPFEPELLVNTSAGKPQKTSPRFFYIFLI